MHFFSSLFSAERLGSLFFGVALVGLTALAQTDQRDLRRNLWDGLPLSPSEYQRHLSPSGKLLLRVPGDWTQPSEKESKFQGPEGVEFTAFVEDIPDGLPVQSFLGALLRNFQSLPGAEETVQVRSIELAGREGREVLIDVIDASGEMSRRIVWCVVDGPHAVSLLFICPASLSPQYEPYFKTIVQSAVLLEKKVVYEIFASRLKKATVKEQPVRIDHVQGLIAALDGEDEKIRQEALSRLAEIAMEDPDPVLDFLLDSRTLLRAAAVEAIGRTRSTRLAPFLVDALSDKSPMVAAKAARKLMEIPGGVECLREDTLNWSTGDPFLLRAARYMPDQSRLEIAQTLFRMGRSTGQRTKKEPESSRNVYFELGLQLAEIIPPRDFPIPLPDIISDGDPEMLGLALSIAARRQETLDSKLVIPLLLHPERFVAAAAAAALAIGGQREDIPALERIIRRPGNEPWETGNQLPDIVNATIEKIRLRAELKGLSGPGRRKLLESKLQDAGIADWVWTQFGVEEFEGPWGTPAPGRSGSLKETAAVERIEPLGQNLLPKSVTLYTAIPDPADALKKLDALMSGVQLPSARDQAGVVLLLANLKESLARQIGTTTERLGFGAVGLAPHAPVVFATWRPQPAPFTVKKADRSAVLLHVTDRERFEAALCDYHTRQGNFRLVAPGAAIVTRFVGLLPALMPPFVEAALRDPDFGKKSPDHGKKKPDSKSDSKTESREVAYTLVFEEECQGRAVTVIDRRSFLGREAGEPDAIFLTYVADTAVMASDRHSLRDLLTRLKTGKDLLSENETFRKAAEATAEAIYLSDLEQIQDQTEDRSDSAGTEYGFLTVSEDRIENEYHLSFKEDSKEEPFERFKPEQLEAPKRLLPATTSLFLLMRINDVKLWPTELDKLLRKAQLINPQSLFKLDLKSEVLPELGPECGAALVGTVRFEGKEFHLPWLVFFALRSQKLVDAFDSGQLFEGEPDSGGFYRVKIGSTKLAATVTGGYLLVAADGETLARLPAGEKLFASPDYQRAVEKTGTPLMAFGGMNTQATSLARHGESDMRTERVIALLDSFVSAFHSHTLSADATSSTLDVRLSVSTGREGRYSVADLATLVSEYDPAFAVVQAQGLPVLDTSQIEALRLRVSVKGTEGAERIAQDITTEYQTVEVTDDNQLMVKVRPRRLGAQPTVQLPIQGPEFEPFLKPTREIRPDNPEIADQARQIIGDEKDAWKAAKKLSDWVFTNLKWKRVEHADSVETLGVREADCLEFSQLYLALARSLGLPARLVTGLAYQDGTFSGHAWVEVFVGVWAELDPTFGTHFVDSGHLRESSGQLLTLGALNLLEIEVVEVTRPIPDSQRDPEELVQKLCEELTQGKTSLLLSALDPVVLVAEYLAPLDWDELTSEDRRRFASAYRRAVSELSIFEYGEPRLLSLKLENDRASALVMESLSDDFYIFELVRKNGAWNLVDVVQSDTHAHLVREALAPTAGLIRKGAVTPAHARLSSFSQALLAISRDARSGGELTDRFLKETPDDPSLRFLKALALMQQENNEGARELLEEITAEPAPPPAALLKLASLYQQAESGADKAIAAYRRYFQIMPGDPRPHAWLAVLYEQQEKLQEAEAEYREAISCDPRNPERQLDLAQFLTLHREYEKALEVIDKAVLADTTGDRLFADLINRFSADDVHAAEQIAAFEPHRLEHNPNANLYLSRLMLWAERSEEALPLARRSVELDPENAFARASLAEILRSLRMYQEAVDQARQGCEIDPEMAFSRYNLACALAVTGKKEEALEHLKKAVESSSYFLYDLPEEQDLKPLSGLPGFEEMLKEAMELKADEDG